MGKLGLLGKGGTVSLRTDDSCETCAKDEGLRQHAEDLLYLGANEMFLGEIRRESEVNEDLMGKI